MSRENLGVTLIGSPSCQSDATLMPQCHLESATVTPARASRDTSHNETLLCRAKHWEYGIISECRTTHAANKTARRCLQLRTRPDLSGHEENWAKATENARRLLPPRLLDRYTFRVRGGYESRSNIHLHSLFLSTDSSSKLRV